MKNSAVIILCVLMITLGYFLSFLFSLNKNEVQIVSKDFEYEKEVLSIIEKLEIQNCNLNIDNQNFYWGTDSVNQDELKKIFQQKKLIFYFSERTCSPCIENIVELINKNFTSEEQEEKIIFISPDYPLRLRNSCYGRRLLTLQSKYLGIPLEKKIFPFFLYWIMI